MKLLMFAAMAASFAYMMLFSDQAKQVRASGLMDRGITPACDSPQAEEAATREFVRAHPDAKLSAFEEVSAQVNQRRCGAVYVSEREGVLRSGTTFSLELDPRSRTLFAIFEPDPFRTPRP